MAKGPAPKDPKDPEGDILSEALRALLDGSAWIEEGLKDYKGLNLRPFKIPPLWFPDKLIRENRFPDDLISLKTPLEDPPLPLSGGRTIDEILADARRADAEREERQRAEFDKTLRRLGGKLTPKI